MFECLALLLQLHGCSPGAAAVAEKSATLNEFRTGNGLSELRVDPKMSLPLTMSEPSGFTPSPVPNTYIVEYTPLGVTVKTPCFVVVPPNVATRLATKRSKSSGATYT